MPQGLSGEEAMNVRCLMTGRARIHLEQMLQRVRRPTAVGTVSRACTLRSGMHKKGGPEAAFFVEARRLVQLAATAQGNRK